MTIAEQLANYCDCFDEKYDNTKDVDELINLISMATCWTSKPCETFLLSERKEVIDLPDCMDCPYEFEPFFKPFKEESFSFTLIKRKGMEETSESVNAVYSEVDETFRLELPLPKCDCKCDECGCPSTYKLLVTYDAGYELLPECLLPVFCNLLTVIKAKNTCDCECDTCDIPTSEPQIKYAEGDIVTVSLETYLGEMLVKQYQRELSMISLCDQSAEIWGIVV